MERNLQQYSDDHGGVGDEREIYQEDSKTTDLFKKTERRNQKQLESDIDEALSTGEQIEDVISRMGEAERLRALLIKAFQKKNRNSTVKERRKTNVFSLQIGEFWLY